MHSASIDTMRYDSHDHPSFHSIHVWRIDTSAKFDIRVTWSFFIRNYFKRR